MNKKISHKGEMTEADVSAIVKPDACMNYIQKYNTLVCPCNPDILETERTLTEQEEVSHLDEVLQDLTPEQEQEWVVKYIAE